MVAPCKKMCVVILCVFTIPFGYCVARGVIISLQYLSSIF
jgi:hypothetical protein